MTTILKQLFKRFTPPMLRSDSPNRPMVVRRRHWLLQETRFLFLTRKGPVEIILKPSLIIGAGFVGVVGMTVIGAVTLFVGFKSVEVVRNESISTAIASAPPTLDEPTDKICGNRFTADLHAARLESRTCCSIPAIRDSRRACAGRQLCRA